MKKPSKPKLVLLLNTAQRAVERWVQAQGDADLWLTAQQAGVLFFLARNDGALIGDIAQALGIGAPAMSGLADRMAREGLLERLRDSKDGRAMRVYLTENGRAGTKRAKAVVGQMNLMFRDGFSEAEMDVVARWLQAMPGNFAATAVLEATDADVSP